MRSYAMTDIGKTRVVNQDYVFSCQEPVGNLPNLFIVADGMGGHQAGDFASSYSVKKFIESVSLSLQKNPHKIFQDAIRYANKELIEKSKANPELKGMGTTMVALTILGDKAYVANVGDSRVYLAHGDMIQQITDDHTYVNDLVKMGAITKEEAHIHARKNVITRAIGANANNEPDCFSVPVEKGDRILLCSDGLYDEVDDELILQVLTRFDDMTICAEDLVAMANENGGNDNISVICIDLED